MPSTSLWYSNNRWLLGGWATRRRSVVINSHLRDRPSTAVPIPEEEAEIRWGQASQFQWSVNNPDKNFYKTIYIPIDDEDENVELIEFPEIERTTETVRVSNPEDAEQYVDVERILTITFQAPNVGEKKEIEQFWKFNLTQWGN